MERLPYIDAHGVELAADADVAWAALVRVVGGSFGATGASWVGRVLGVEPAAAAGPWLPAPARPTSAVPASGPAVAAGPADTGPPRDTPADSPTGVSATRVDPVNGHPTSTRPASSPTEDTPANGATSSHRTPTRPASSPAVGAALPGFAVDRVRPGELLSLRGQHRFSRYRLDFEVVRAEPGRSWVWARTWAEFPGLRGAAYRALVIGTGAHAVVVRHMLRRVAAGP